MYSRLHNPAKKVMSWRRYAVLLRRTIRLLTNYRRKPVNLNTTLKTLKKYSYPEETNNPFVDRGAIYDSNKYNHFRIPEQFGFSWIGYSGVSPFCCGIVEIGGWFISSKFDKPELLSRAVKECMQATKCRTVLTSTAHRFKESRTEEVLESIGFSRLTSSKNPKTNNTVVTWGFSCDSL